MKNYKLSMTTDILAPRIKHLTSENKALKNKVKQLEEGVKFAKTMGNLTKLSLIKLEEEKSEIYDLLVGENGVKRYTHEEIVLFIINQFEIIDIPDDKYKEAWFECVRKLGNK